MSMANPSHKDRLFNFLFGSDENKSWTLSLYNAVSGSSYTDPEDITITTIREIMYLGMHNDLSFVIHNEMNLYEQQSTYNPNMPLRLLQYIGHLYEKYILENMLNKYSSKQLSLPVPKLVVFYNGRSEKPDETILHLSDAFPKGADADIAVRVKMLNINSERNRELMQACKPLEEYAWLVEKVRINSSNTEKDSRLIVIDRAITAMPDDFLIKPFLEAHRAEVRGMLLDEYNEAEQMELFRRDGIEEGREEGRKEGLEEGREIALRESLQRMVQLKGMDPHDAMDLLGIPAEEQARYAELCTAADQ